MFKNLGKKVGLLLIFMLLMLGTACQEHGDLTSQAVSSLTEMNGEVLVDIEAIEDIPDKEAVEPADLRTSPEGDKDSFPEDEEIKKYQVHPSHYMIFPVEHEEDKVVLLTFDDAPTAKATGQILDTLDKYDAKALFFVNGHYAEPNLDTLKEIANRGHLIGNHTWWHKFLRQESPETVREEIVSLNDFIEEHIGERPKFFRPPYGQNSDISLEIIAEEGMQTMNWSNGSLDWELKTAEAITEQVITNLKPGDNILFHDKQITAEALDEILKQITEQGYHFALPTEVILED